MHGGESRLLLDKKFLLLKEQELCKRGFQFTKYIFYIHTQIYKDLEPPETRPDFYSRKKTKLSNRLLCSKESE